MLDLIEAIHRGIDLRKAVAWPLYNSTELLDRSAYVTASEVGYCERKVKMDKMQQRSAETGYTKTKASDDWGFWERGHNVEAWAVEYLLSGWIADTWQPMFLGKDQVSFTCGIQSGTPDGVFVNTSTDEFITLDIKSFDPRTNVNRLPKLPHVDQVIQNSDLIAENMDLSPAGGVLLYINASNYKDMHVKPVEWSDEHADRLEKKAERIMNTAPEDLKAEGLFKDDCRYCNHTAACSRMIREEKNGKGYHDDLDNAGAKLFG